MKKSAVILSIILFFMLVAVSSASPVPLLRIPTDTEIRCEGFWSGHLQGICSDGKKRIYWVFDSHLVQTDLKGKLINATMLKRNAGHSTHGGSPCYANGMIYVPFCGGDFNTANTAPYNFIQVYDEKDLSLLKSFPVPEVSGGVGAITYADGSFFITGGRLYGVPGNTVYEYSDTFSLIRTHKLPFNSWKGVQTLTYDGRNFWFGCYGVRRFSWRTDRNFKVTGCFLFDGSYGMVPVGGNRLLIASAVSRKEGPFRAGGKAQVKDVRKFQQTVCFLKLDPEGRVWFENKVYSAQELSAALQKYRRKRVIISWPANLPAEKLIAVISLVNHGVSTDFDVEIQ